MFTTRMCFVLRWWADFFYITGLYIPVKRKRCILKVVRGCKLVPYLGFVFFVISDPFKHGDEHPHEIHHHQREICLVHFFLFLDHLDHSCDGDDRTTHVSDHH